MTIAQLAAFGGVLAAVVSGLIGGAFLLAKAYIESESAKLQSQILLKSSKLAAEISQKNAELNTSLEAAKQLAENRQNWIDALRQEMSDFLVLCGQTDHSKRDFDGMAKASSMIELRMNPKDDDYRPLQNAMTKCIAVKNDEEFDAGVSEFIKVSQRILKREWDVLKSELNDLTRVSPPDRQTNLE